MSPAKQTHHPSGPRWASTFASLSADQMSALKDLLARQMDGAHSVVDAAGRFLGVVATGFSPSLILARIYGTVPYEKLPETERRFAAALIGQDNRQRLRPETPTLVLLGSRGRRSEWNDRLASRGHLAIPLLGKDFVAGIPMIASLLREIGLQLEDLDLPGAPLTRKLMGGFNGVFFVPNARLGRDAQQRLVIPDQDFVSTHDVRSVFGMGGAYPWGGFVSVIVFANETLSRPTAERYTPLLSVFKTATSSLVGDGKIFSA